jgi:hypothetical protein
LVRAGDSRARDGPDGWAGPDTDGAVFPESPVGFTGGSLNFPVEDMHRMENLLATGAAGFAVLLFGLALLAMTVGQYQMAGFSFLSASVVIYLRETRLV